MGSGASVPEAEAQVGPIVTVEQAQEIMAIVFSRNVTHEQLKTVLVNPQPGLIGEDLVQRIFEVLDRPAVEAVEPVSVENAGTDLPSAVRNTFFGQFESVKQAFAAADVNGGGTISHEEFAECVRRGGLIISDEQIAAVTAYIDSDQNGNINYQEFLRFLVNAEAPDEASAQVVQAVAGSLRTQIFERFKSMRKAFLSLDPDGSGCIDTAEVQQLLRGQNFSYSDEDINLFVASFPHEKEGGFSYVEFCKMVEGQQPFA